MTRVSNIAAGNRAWGDDALHVPGPASAFTTALAWRAEGRRVALATVVETRAGAPQPLGSVMVVDGDGSFQGAVSGGCVEAAIVEEAMDLLASGSSSRFLDFTEERTRVWSAAPPCGGRLRVLLTALGSSDDRQENDWSSGPAPLAAWIAARTQGRAVVLATRNDGRRRVVDADQNDPLAHAAADLGGTGSGLFTPVLGAPTFLFREMPRTRLVIVGAGAIAEALAPMAALAEFEVVVVDPREAFLKARRLPGARRLHAWPDEPAVRDLLDRRTAVVALGHVQEIDDRGLVSALTAGVAYIGALGSKETHARRLERLAARGIDGSAIRGPVGLPLGARGPGEIAVAILAEIVAAKNSCGAQS